MQYFDKKKHNISVDCVEDTTFLNTVEKIIQIEETHNVVTTSLHGCVIMCMKSTDIVCRSIDYKLHDDDSYCFLIASNRYMEPAKYKRTQSDTHCTVGKCIVMCRINNIKSKLHLHLIQL